MSIKLMVPMSEELVWANVMRPRVPLVYLDLNTIIYFARTLRGDRKVPAGYDRLAEAAARAKAERRAAFPLGEAHLWEISKISDPKQRRWLAKVLEGLCDFNYLLGRVVIAELEFDAGMAKVVGGEPKLGSLPLLRPTFGQVFGWVGGVNILGAEGRDASEAVRAEIGAAAYRALRRQLDVDVERCMLQGPSDEDLVELRKDPDYRPEAAIASLQSRVEWEVATQRVLNQEPKWRRGRLRDVICGREVLHEWGDVLTRLRVDRVRRSGVPSFGLSDAELRCLLGSLPHAQVAVSVKTRMHKNPRHNWTANDLTDIDAMSVAYAYCEAVFPDKAVRHALLNSKELRTMGTFVPRHPDELAEWLDALPTVVGPDILVPHPLIRSGST